MCQISSQSDERCQKKRGGVRLTPPCLHVTFLDLCLIGLIFKIFRAIALEQKHGVLLLFA